MFTPGVDFINCLHHAPIFCALRQTFTQEKSFSKVGGRRGAQMDRAAISMICAVCPTFMKSTLGLGLLCIENND